MQVGWQCVVGVAVGGDCEECVAVVGVGVTVRGV